MERAWDWSVKAQCPGLRWWWRTSRYVSFSLHKCIRVLPANDSDAQRGCAYCASECSSIPRYEVRLSCLPWSRLSWTLTSTSSHRRQLPRSWYPISAYSSSQGYTHPAYPAAPRNPRPTPDKYACIIDFIQTIRTSVACGVPGSREICLWRFRDALASGAKVLFSITKQSDIMSIPDLQAMGGSAAVIF
jgi:hypothetical protein